MEQERENDNGRKIGSRERTHGVVEVERRFRVRGRGKYPS